jgi:hypothetical protein
MSIIHGKTWIIHLCYGRVGMSMLYGHPTKKKTGILKDGFPEQIIDDHPSRLQGHGKYHPS